MDIGNAQPPAFFPGLLDRSRPRRMKSAARRYISRINRLKNALILVATDPIASNWRTPFEFFPYPGGISAISPVRAAQPGSRSTTGNLSTLEGRRASDTTPRCDPSGVGNMFRPRNRGWRCVTGGALRDPRLISWTPPGSKTGYASVG